METILRMVERKYGKARRIWVMDRGIVSEENLAASGTADTYQISTQSESKVYFGIQKVASGRTYRCKGSTAALATSCTTNAW